MRSWSAIAGLVAVLTASRVAHATVGVALTPPMGYNTWNYWSCSVNATILMEAADIFVSSGLAQAGYLYVNRYV
jgi:alpha-galactosidase